MHKDYDLSAVARANNAKKRAKRYSGDSLRYSSSTGMNVFAYKGVLIEKNRSGYKVHKEIQMKGTDPALAAGNWTDAGKFKYALDRMLETADAGRLAELREKRQNYLCTACKGATYLSKQNMIESTSGSLELNVHCYQCGAGSTISHVQIISDEKMY